MALVQLKGGNWVRQDTVVRFFDALAAQANSRPDRLSMARAGFVWRQGECCFSLQSLYRLLCGDGDETYNEFKAAIYKSRLNQELAQLGYRVDVHYSTGNVDTSTYKLVRL